VPLFECACRGQWWARDVRFADGHVRDAIPSRRFPRDDEARASSRDVAVAARGMARGDGAIEVLDVGVVALAQARFACAPRTGRRCDG